MSAPGFRLPFLLQGATIVTIYICRSGREPVTILVAPGLYILDKPLKIKPSTGSSRFTIQALVMPGDMGWTPSKMPVIQCVSDSNREGQLRHASIALAIMRNGVTIGGLKFLGNPHPLSEYYYAIKRRDSSLKDLEISQCYFIGDRYSAPMQGGVFAQGRNIRIDHCTFYGCKNAVMIFLGLQNFSLTHSIIYGAYEGALWYGYGPSADAPFIFDHNIVAQSHYFFVGYKGIHPNYIFRNSVITGNSFYMGFNGDIITRDLDNRPHEVNILKSAKLTLREITAGAIPLDYLQPAPGTPGADLDAGIFIKGGNK